jgi:surface antigen
MATVWIGDFRCKSLQYVYEASSKATEDHSYIIEDFGGADWFSSNALYQLEKLCPVSSHIVVATGFIDCVNSCIWKTINIKKVAENYKTALEKLKNNYNGHLFYFCSVPPVDGDYSNAFATDGIITVKELNAKIKSFNSAMEEKCPVTFLDCYDYVTKTSLMTRDGIRYTNTMAKALQTYVKGQLDLQNANVVIGTTFMSKIRATNTDAPNPQDESFKYWTKENNECIEMVNGCVLPNCTGYAWGRFYEITGEKPKLSTDDARDWFNYTQDGYERGTKPRVGAVLCWSSDEYGHVAIVEAVNADGTIVISQSAWRHDGNYNNVPYEHTNTDHFWTQTLTNSDGHWGWHNGGYTFQGFIYCPQTTKVIAGDNPNINTGLCTANSYGITRTQMTPNAKYIWQYLGSRGWTVNAVSALLGNMETESKMSPCVWETTTDYTSNQVKKNADGSYTINENEVAKIATGLGRDDKYSVGYGLTQWTPYTKYTTWCKDGKSNGTGKVLPFWSIDSQLTRILDEVKAGEESWTEEVEKRRQWISKSAYGFDLSFKEFTTSTKSIAWLTEAFLRCYERPYNVEGTLPTRVANANYWYSVIKNISVSAIATYTTRTTTVSTRTTAKAISASALPVVGSDYLSEEQRKPYAQYIWQYLGSRGWTKNAVAGLLGNIEAESGLNPHLWQGRVDGSIIGSDGKHTLDITLLNSLGYDIGYGLVQWTNYDKYTDWCTKNKLNYWEIDSQLKRIEYEAANNFQWSTSYYDSEITFKEFTLSNKSAYELAYAFVCCYERPGSIIYGDAESRAATKKERGDNANKWLTFLNTLSPDIITDTSSSNSSTTTTPSTSTDTTTTTTTIVKNTQLRLYSFKVDKKTATQAQLSFVANNCTSCSYELKHDKSVIKTKKGTFKGGIKTFILKDLKPSTKYSIKLEVLGANSTKETKEISFTTLQSYPDSVRAIKLEPKLTNNFKDANNNFILTIKKPSSLGYWKNNINGYELWLYVNGIPLKTVKIFTVKDFSVSNFSIKKIFGYTCKTGDTIQVGIRTWVKTDAGKTLYDATAPLTSKSFCLLDKPIMPYLNLKTE